MGGQIVSGLTYRVTQVFTGHGCFGDYLCRIEKERTTECHHCGDALDSTQHTLAECAAFGVQRGALTDKVRVGLSLPAVAATMIREREA